MENIAQLNSNIDEESEFSRSENYDSDATDMSGEFLGEDDDQEEQASPRIQRVNRPNLSRHITQEGYDVPNSASSSRESSVGVTAVEIEAEVPEGSSTDQQMDAAQRGQEEPVVESEPEDMQVEDQLEVVLERQIENQIEVDDERQTEDQVEVVDERQAENQVVVIGERQAGYHVEVVGEVEVIEVELEEETETEEHLQFEEQREAEETVRAVDSAVIAEVQSPAVLEHPKQETPKKEISKSVAPPSPDSEDDDGQICPICFEPWSNSGNHRLSSLKCGHIFGQACIERWLKGQGGKCPQCNAKATKKDIRVLYAKSLKVIDTSERDRVLQDLEKEREARRKLELEHAQTKLKYELKAQLVMKLQNELQTLRQSASSVSAIMDLSQSQGGESKKGKLLLHTSMELQKDGGCRVMAFNSWLNMLVVSVPSQVLMFPGFGVKKVNMLDVKAERYVPIHQKQIRDMAFNPAKNDLLLTVGIDKVAKLTNVCSNATVQTFTAEAPLWACCWDFDQPNVFYVGTSIGTVVKFDTRLTIGSVETLHISGSGPVVSLCFVPRASQDSFPMTGLLVARLQSCSFMEMKEDGSTRDHTLPLEGPFTSVSFENSSRHFLVSCRPSQKFPHARHMLCSLSSVNISTEPEVPNNVASSNIIHTFKGGTTQKVLSRSCLLKRTSGVNSNGNVLACTSDESNQSTYVWDTSTANCVQQLKGFDTVIDILPVNTTSGDYLSLLSDKTLKVFKWADVLS